MSHGPTFQQVRALVEQLRARTKGAAVFGLYSPGRYTEARHVRSGDDWYCVAQCDSLLQLRAELQTQEPDVTVKVLVSSVKDEQLSDDIRVRLFKGHLHTLRTWEIVKSLLQVRHIDSRIGHDGWVAEALLQAASGAECPKVAGGVLDAETAWRLLLSRRLGLDDAQPDLVALLDWSMEQVNTDRFRGAEELFRAKAAEWLAQSAGPAVPAVLRCVQGSTRPDALAVGLSLGVIFHEGAAGQLDRAAGRIEQYCGGLPLERTTALQWAAAAAEVVRLRLMDAKRRRPWLDRADEILRAVGADSFAQLSDLSPLGLRQRLDVFARHLLGALAETPPRISPELQVAAFEARRHLLASCDPRCVGRLDMAIRLLRWLAVQESASCKAAPSFADAAREYAAEGGHVDWARQVLRGGEATPELARAYATLTARVTEERQAQNRTFAELLREALAACSWPEDLPPVEEVLGRVVAPLAGKSPVLLLVLDGMSQAVYRELLDDLTQAGWAELRPQQAPFAAAVAVLPSVTRASRTSLLCGQLRAGQASDELAGFPCHPGLLAVSKKGLPPLLFHKATLHGHGEASLAADVRQEIANPARRVVGVVINAVDDHLSRGEQTDPRWGRDFIKPLPALLDEARSAGRLVVLASDHGHVLDQGTEQRPGEEGERWRGDDGRLTPDEVRLVGPRVLLGGGHVIVPWSERVRYTGKKNGYHGGASLQEVIVPLTVLSPGGEPPVGWVEVATRLPSWWEQEPRTPASAHLSPTAKGSTDQGDRAEPPHSWVDDLLASEAYRAQRSLAGPNAPPDDVVRSLLLALDAHGGTMSEVTLASRLGVPPSRLPAVLASVRRLLNAEGYAVLTKDEASGLVGVNRDLLTRQFGLTSADVTTR